MKKLSIVVSIILLSSYLSHGQLGKSNLDFYLDIGFANVFFDGIGGPLMGLTLANEKDDYGFSIRKDFLIELGRISYIDTNNIIFSTEKIEIQRYYVLTYLEGYLGLKRYINAPLSLGLGYGWINTNYRENVSFNRDYGYGVLTVKAIYEVSWVAFEIRSFIPIKKNYFDRYYPFARLSPIELSVFYRFRPKKNS